MVNGRASLAIYVGAWVAVLAVIIGSVVVAIAHADAPPILMIALSAAFGILGGAHIMPPMSKGATEKTLAVQEAEKGTRNGQV